MNQLQLIFGTTYSCTGDEESPEQALQEHHSILNMHED